MSAVGWLIWSMGELAILGVLVLLWVDLSTKLASRQDTQPSRLDDEPEEAGVFHLSDLEAARLERQQLRESRNRAVSLDSERALRASRST